MTNDDIRVGVIERRIETFPAMYRTVVRAARVVVNIVLV